MPALVLKFGGACLLTLDDFTAVADYVARRIADGRPAVVVASAMSGTSGNLEELVNQVNPDPPPATAAAALAAADQLSAGLLAAALARSGTDVDLLAFNQVGLIADGNALRGRLSDIDGTPLRAALQACQVAVMPGGQGMDRDGGLVTFGRNSSDLSAVSAAVAVGAAQCEIFSDIPGMYTADPRLVPGALPLPRVRYAVAAEMARSGAKILQRQAIELALQNGVQIICRGQPPAAVSATLVSEAGHWQPVVVALPRSSVWVFADPAAARGARDRLAAEGVDAISHQRHLIVVTAVSGHVLSRVCDPSAKLTGLRLLSIFETEGYPAMRLLIPADELTVAARAWHARLHPPSDTGRQQAWDAAPRRSPFSRVMFEISD